MLQQWIIHLWQKRTWAILLLPLSLLYFSIIHIRRWLYRIKLFKTYHAPVPVVIIGNINVGGTGKTPLTLHLANTLQQHGFFPGIVSRGYKAKIPVPQEVTASSDPLLCGDEPTLMAQQTTAPIFVHKNRELAIKALLKAYPQCDVILSDDGLQHYALHRDIELAVLDLPRSIGNGWLLPAGPLRETIQRLKTVDFIIYHQSDKTPTPSLSVQTAALPIHMQLFPQAFYQLTQPTHHQTADYFMDKACHAITGIGHPARFFTSLQQMGIACQYTAFNDHHPFTAKDLPADDIILLTEKDAVKLAGLKDDRIWVLPIEVKLEPNLTTLIVAKLTTFKADHHG